MQIRWLLVLCVALPACFRSRSETPVTFTEALSDEERLAGFRLLFDGSSLKGWRCFRSTGTDGWAVQGGAITRVGSGGDLITEEEFGDFELRFRWKISPGGNSGVLYHVTEREDAVWKTGLEYQILDDARHEDGKNPLTSAGALYGLVAPPATKHLEEAGEWNDGIIRVEKGRITHLLNTDETVETTIADVRAKIPATKFAAFPQFAQAASGHIALQDHGNEVAFKSLRIRPRPEL